MKVKRMKSYTQTLPNEHLKALEQLARVYGVSVSEFVRNRIIPQFLGSLPNWSDAEQKLKQEVPA